MLTRTRVVGTAVVILLVVVVTTAVAAVGHEGGSQVDVPFVLFSVLGGTGLGLTGALLLALRPGHRLGPVLAVTGGALVLEFALRELALAGGPAGWVPTAVWLSLVADVTWFPLGIVLVLLLFPDGRAASAAWGRLVQAVLALGALRILVRALTDGPLDAESHGLTVPWSGVRGLDGLAGPLDLLAVLAVLPAVASLVVRFRRAESDDRQRLKPLAAAGLVLVVGLAVQQVPGLHGLGVGVFVAAITVALPVALAVGALRYRVWDLDPVVVGTLVYTGLAALVTGVYIAVVVVVSEVAGTRVATPDLGPSVAATALVALGFGPTKQYLDRAARRLVYGVRSSPYAVLRALPHQLVEASATSDVLPRTADALARGLGVPAARVRARLEDGTSLQTWSPSGTVAADEDLVVVQVRHAGLVVGDVAVLPSADRPLGTRDRALLDDLAAQAGPAIRGVALDAALRARLEEIEHQAQELQESRRRIVGAQLAERRRIERDIHDGAQQQLVGLAVRLRAASDLVDDPVAARAEIAAAGSALDACIDGLRELARGIYPPVLTARGLAAALRAQARTGANDVVVESTPALDQDRPPAAVEVAAYFCCLEAIQNAAKHAPDARVYVRLSRTDDALVIEISDDGPGFDVAAAPGAPGGGTGLLGMQDRVGAAGGSFVLTSSPGEGTRIRARIPVR